MATATATETPTATPTVTHTVTPSVTPTATPSPTPATGGVTGLIYGDANGNSFPDPGEPLLAGARMTLQEGGVERYVTVSDLAGIFHFTDVAPGQYALIETEPPPGYLPYPALLLLEVRANYTLGGISLPHQPAPTATPTLTATPTDTPIPTPTLTTTATATPTATHTATPTHTAAPSPTPSSTPTPYFGEIRGAVWHDRDGNGVRSAGESGLARVRINILQDGILIRDAITSADGGYSFQMAPPGHYTVAEINPPDLAYSSTPDEVIVSVGVGESVLVDFGDWSGAHIYLPLLWSE